MFSRIMLFLITLFWAAMNFLLWRSEFGERNHLGSSVPAEVVWRKILTAPDASALEIVHHNRAIGNGQWAANIGQNSGIRKIIPDELPPEGMDEEGVTGYQIDFTGNAALSDVPGRLSFNFNLKMTTNQVWQEFSLVLKLHSSAWEIHSLAAEQTVHLKMRDEDQKFERVFKFADLQNPQVLARQLDLPFPEEFFHAFGLSPKVQSPASLSAGLVWEARNDWITIGHTPVRAYRLQAALFDRYRIVVIVSQVGEILRVELPDDWLLKNSDLTTL